MPLESGTFINSLVPTNPVGASDPKSAGDDHLRLIKSTLKNTFPNINGAVNFTPTQANNWFTSGTYNMNNSSLNFTWVDGSASGILYDNFKDSDSPAAADSLLLFDAAGRNSIAAKVIYSRILTRISDPVSGTEDGEVFIQTRQNGILTTRIQITPTEVLLDGVALGDIQSFPTGTKMLFQQTAAPAGWTKETAHNNKALRVVSGAASSGGTLAFTTAFAVRGVAGTVGATALSVSQLPSHNHSVSGDTGLQSANHTHSFSDSATTSSSGSGTTSSAGAHTHGLPTKSGTSNKTTLAAKEASSEDEFVVSSASAGAHTHTFGNHTHSVTVSGTTGSNSASHSHTFSATSSSTGSGATHTHTFTGTSIDLSVQYVDLIIASKN